MCAHLVANIFDLGDLCAISNLDHSAFLFLLNSVQQDVMQRGAHDSHRWVALAFIVADLDLAKLVPILGNGDEAPIGESFRSETLVYAVSNVAIQHLQAIWAQTDGAPACARRVPDLEQCRAYTVLGETEG